MSRIRKTIEKYYRIPKQVRASLWFLICSVLQKGVSVLTTPIFTRILDTGNYGQYTVFNSWLDIISIFVTFRLYYGVFGQGLVKFEEDKEQYASSMQGLALTLNLIWTVIYLLFRDYWNHLFKLTTVQMLAMLVMIWSTGAFRFWATAQRNEYKYRALVILTLVVSVLKPAIGIFFVLHSEDKATARILGLALVELIGYSWLFFVQMKRGRRFFSAKYWKHALMFNIPLIPHYLSQTVLNSSDRIMIRNMIGVSEAGIYGLAYSVSRLPGILDQALIQTFSPWAYHKMKAGRAKDIGEISTAMMIGMAAIILILIILAPEVVYVFAPEPYHDAIWIIPPVAMSVFFTFLYNLFSTVEFYFEKTRHIMAASLSGAVLNIILNLIFIRRYGYYAAGYTTLLCYLVYCFAHYYFMRRISDTFLEGVTVFDPKIVAMISIGLLCAGFLIMATYTHTVARYGILLCMFGFMIIKRKQIKKYAVTILRMRKKRS